MRRLPALAGLGVALAAGAALLVYAPHDPAPAPAARVPLATAWPGAQRAELPGNLRDGPLYHPGLFLDARTSVGTAPSPDGTAERLVLRGADGAVRELRRRPLSTNPDFSAFATAGDDLAWVESADGGATELWTAKTSGGPARRLTTDTGNAVFFGSQWDLVLAGGRVHWAAAGPGGEPTTEIRSVALTGGAVAVREEPGSWALTAWPWLTDGGGDQAGTTRLRNTETGRDTPVETSGPELITCAPAWCRVLVMNGDGLARIDLMHPDGSARRRIAGGAAGAAVPDVAVLDRFELLSETAPDSDLTGTAGLLVYDIKADRTVDVTPAADGVFCRNGVLWWATGDQDSLAWHTLDLRTV
ncbi:hypothetical protein Ani05nite_21310 [Amorphoplanes nipponensis]|uniref:Uncharacterized protein n=1 Tax=Actinoplanes nipponensis TaxID=135950 RepID=A0A919JGH3_9ACTN|nr:hypothetical protein [Actinoplanes nipponensis]GIE48597.1 hypothetical protein Ani05nite_21310 [Actinoplanes nipponensis]